MIRICNSIVQNIPIICNFFIKLKITSLIQASTKHISHPFLSPPRFWEMLHKVPSTSSKCPSKEHFTGPYSGRTAFSLQSLFPFLSATSIYEDIIQSIGTLSFHWDLDCFKWGVSLYSGGYISRLLLHKESINLIPLISSHCIACFTLSAKPACTPNGISVSDLPVILTLFTVSHCIYKSNQRGGQESSNVDVKALFESTQLHPTKLQDNIYFLKMSKNIFGNSCEVHLFVNRLRLARQFQGRSKWRGLQKLKFDMLETYSCKLYWFLLRFWINLQTLNNVTALYPNTLWQS